MPLFNPGFVRPSDNPINWTGLHTWLTAPQTFICPHNNPSDGPMGIVLDGNSQVPPGGAIQIGVDSGELAMETGFVAYMGTVGWRLQSDKDNSGTSGFHVLIIPLDGIFNTVTDFDKRLIIDTSMTPADALAAGVTPLRVWLQGGSFGEQDIEQWGDGLLGAFVSHMELNGNGRLKIEVPNSIPPNTSLIASRATWYLDEAEQSLRAKVLYSDGVTFRTARLPLINQDDPQVVGALGNLASPGAFADIAGDGPGGIMRINVTADPTADTFVIVEVSGSVTQALVSFTLYRVTDNGAAIGRGSAGWISGVPQGVTQNVAVAASEDDISFGFKYKLLAGSGAHDLRLQWQTGAAGGSTLNTANAFEGITMKIQQVRS